MLNLFEMRPRSHNEGAHHADPCSAHRFLRSLFGAFPDGQRPYLWRRFDPSQKIVVLSSCALGRMPYEYEVMPPKPFAPHLTAGEPLQFSLRANPVVQSMEPRPDGTERPVRHDVVMHARWHQDPQDPKPKATLIQEEGTKWLRRQGLRTGFSFADDAVQVEGYCQYKMRRGAGHRPFVMATLDFDGLLTVEDPERLVQAVAQGLGPSKAYGCGLMLLRRPLL